MVQANILSRYLQMLQVILTFTNSKPHKHFTSLPPSHCTCQSFRSHCTCQGYETVFFSYNLFTFTARVFETWEIKSWKSFKKRVDVLKRYSPCTSPFHRLVDHLKSGLEILMTLKVSSINIDWLIEHLLLWALKFVWLIARLFTS